MPCADPIFNDRDERASRTAKILWRLHEEGEHFSPGWVRDVWLWPSGERLDEVTQTLCDFCKAKGEDWIYNGRNPLARAVADWWDEHKQSPSHEPLSE